MKIICWELSEDHIILCVSTLNDSPNLHQSLSLTDLVCCLFVMIVEHSGDTKYCVDDGNAPAYMNISPKAWKHATLDSCCWQNFQTNFRECMGSQSYSVDKINPCPAVETSGKYYVEYYSEGDRNCVMDCDGPAPCGGLAQSYMETYDSFDDCCDHHLWFLPNSPCPVL